MKIGKAIVFMASLLMACSEQPATLDVSVKVESQALSGSKWKLIRWSEESPIPKGITISAKFDEAVLSGTSAVNMYTVSYVEAENGSLSVGHIAVTEMAGSEDAMRAESKYLSLLSKSKSFVLGTETLTLKNELGRDILVFSAE